MSNCELKSEAALQSDITILEKEEASLEAALKAAQSELKRYRKSLKNIQKDKAADGKGEN